MIIDGTNGSAPSIKHSTLRFANSNGVIYIDIVSSFSSFAPPKSYVGTRSCDTRLCDSHERASTNLLTSPPLCCNTHENHNAQKSVYSFSVYNTHKHVSHKTFSSVASTHHQCLSRGS